MTLKFTSRFVEFFVATRRTYDVSINGWIDRTLNIRVGKFVYTSKRGFFCI